MNVPDVVICVSVLAYRPAPKNQIASLMIGPPNVASQVWLIFWGPSVPFGGVADQAGLVRLSRSDPLKVLPPAFVMVLMTPPANRPYSAEMPPVWVVVSWTASSM